MQECLASMSIQTCASIRFQMKFSKLLDDIPLVEAFEDRRPWDAHYHDRGVVVIDA